MAEKSFKVMPLDTLKKAGINALLASILILTGITFANAEIASFPPYIVLFGIILIVIGFIFVFRTIRLLIVYYKDGGFS
ncbi:MAG TPA: hypothetical protein DCF68_14370 [Cyanothece sp. UBA12306]|nr:hypothetical protein [Cyanothece sp. UBA12306]